MSVFTMVAVIVVVCVGADVLVKYFKTTEGRTKSGATETDVRGLNAEVERLRERVHVLERIITDENRDLKDDFRGLV